MDIHHRGAESASWLEAVMLNVYVLIVICRRHYTWNGPDKLSGDRRGHQEIDAEPGCVVRLGVRPASLALQVPLLIVNAPNLT